MTSFTVGLAQALCKSRSQWKERMKKVKKTEARRSTQFYDVVLIHIIISYHNVHF